MGSYTITAEKVTPKDENEILADSLLRQASIALHKRRYEEAGKYLTDALALARQNPKILAALALCLAEGESKFLSAEKLARQAIRLAPRYAGGYHAIGRIYMLGGKLAQARDNLRRAALLDPHDQRIQKHLRELDRRKVKAIWQRRQDLIGAVVGGARNFLSRDRHLVLIACMVLVSLVGLGLNLYARDVENREMELAQFLNQKAFLMQNYAYERRLLLPN